ncbi:O-antigen ligase family protein [uncultured Fusobacterium sp.]|uniref:O-antigen ligase family protein n=1 Tax=uncultured Fusobacterium sp. TaxID=159267 RepID=UPI0025E204E9|nr:O-antigen ligase family protein [uncultured Fusobacterium sp.]
MENIEKSFIKKNKEKLNIFGEFVSYLYIISVFFNSKLNMKIGYILLVLGILKLIFFKEDIKKIDKKVYGAFSILFLIGIITNLLVGRDSGINYFIRENSKFIYSSFLLLFLKDRTEKINISIYLGLILLCIGVIFKNDWFLGNYTRQRGVLILGIIYIIINFLENFLKKEYKKLYSLPVIILSCYTMVVLNSRMAVLVIIGCVSLYCLFILFFRREYKVYKVFILMFLGAFLTFISLPNSYKEHLKTSFYTKNNGSNEARIIMWKAGVNIFKENPILGIGTAPKTAKKELVEYVENNMKDHWLAYEFIKNQPYSRLHSMYIDFFVQNGIFGVLYLLLLFGIIPVEFYKKRYETVTTSAFFSILGFYIYGITWSIWSDYGIIQTAFQIILAIMLI